MRVDACAGREVRSVGRQCSNHMPVGFGTANQEPTVHPGVPSGRTRCVYSGLAFSSSCSLSVDFGRTLAVSGVGSCSPGLCAEIVHHRRCPQQYSDTKLAMDRLWRRIRTIKQALKMRCIHNPYTQTLEPQCISLQTCRLNSTVFKVSLHAV